MNQLLSEEELRRQIIEHVSGIQTGVVSHTETTNALIALVNSQKLAWADMVIGEDNWSNSTGTISTGNQTIKKSTYIHVRNELRAEQRQRNNLNATTGEEK